MNLHVILPDNGCLENGHHLFLHLDLYQPKDRRVLIKFFPLNDLTEVLGRWLVPLTELTAPEGRKTILTRKAGSVTII